MPSRKSPQQKRDEAPPPHVSVLTQAKGAAYPPGRMLVASPLAVAAVVRRIPAGRVLRLGDLRAHLADQFDADYTCPMTTGIFIRIVAEAAAAEADAELPYWRVVRDDGRLLDKLPEGTAALAARLQQEGLQLAGGQRLPAAELVRARWHP